MTLKQEFQRLINAGSVATMAQLRSFVTERGLIVTKHSEDSVTVVMRGHRRFRLFPANHYKAGRAGVLTDSGIVFDFWIYALVAQGSVEAACYIGQTRSVARRMREHWTRRTGERCSGPLLHWATERGLTVHVVLLQALSVIQSEADRAEAEWLACATAAGYDVPGVEIWAPAHQRSRPGLTWPSAAVRRNCRPLEEVIAGTSQIVRLEKRSTLVDHPPEEFNLV
ncbi:hypothetical protein PSUB009319_20640 [Ralstonia sp. SET104]|nr:hypothetical protein PSUB009319_20640 [Ralstonia sp. SET104]